MHHLVQAILSPDASTSMTHWHKWAADTNLDNISFEELKLIPILYQKWKDTPGFAFDERTGGVARKFFYQNTVYQHSVKELSNAFTQKNIPARFVRNVLVQRTLADAGYPGFCLGNLDIAVMPEKLEELWKSILSLHWTYKEHSRLLVTLSHPKGLQLQVHLNYIRYWDTERQMSFFHSLDQPIERRFTAVVELLLRDDEMQQTTTASHLFLSILLKHFTSVQLKSLTETCDSYLLSHRFEMARNFRIEGTSAQEVVPGIDPLTKLQNTFKHWMAHRTFANKLAYHRLRFQLLNKDHGPKSIYRYWRMQRKENQEVRKWLLSIQQHLLRK